MREILAARAMPGPSHMDDDPGAWPASLRLEHGVFESRYRVLRSLSDGGMGEVVLAEHLSLGKRVAIKIIREQYRGDAATEERFVLETRAAARIHHENVVGISDFGRTADGRMFFVMEYLEGEDLAQTLRREGPLPWKRVVHMTRHVCRGIGEAHRRGVLHRDIKPANCIRVSVDGDPDFIKVVDFGLAKLFGPQDVQRRRTNAGVVLGTPGYMAPEVEAGHRPDPRVDLYSIGVLMIRLLTGKLPDEGGIKLLGEMLELPSSLLRLLYKALREDPDERFQTAAALEEALDYVLAASARPPSLRSVKHSGRPVTASKLQAPGRGASGPAAAARSMTAPARGLSGPLPAAEPDSPERPTQRLHSGALAGRAPTQPRPVAPPTVVVRRPSRAWLGWLVLGLLLGGAAVYWYMSQRTAAQAPDERPAAPMSAAPMSSSTSLAPSVAAPVPEPEPVKSPEPAASKRKRAPARSSGDTDLKNPFERR